VNWNSFVNLFERRFHPLRSLSHPRTESAFSFLVESTAGILQLHTLKRFTDTSCDLARSPVVLLYLL
jgi:hypothetical protein